MTMSRSPFHLVVCPNSRSNASPVGEIPLPVGKGHLAGEGPAGVGDDGDPVCLQGIALAGVFQILISEAGRRTREGETQDQIADGLRPAIEAILDDLDRWLALGNS
jgi:hypothetical protein